jgi:hypothetical protein
LKWNNWVQSINVIKIRQANYRTPSVMSLSTPSSFSAIQKWQNAEYYTSSTVTVILLICHCSDFLHSSSQNRTEPLLHFLLPPTMDFHSHPNFFLLLSFSVLFLSSLHVQAKVTFKYCGTFNLSLFWLFNLHFEYS